ncbi:MAG: PQ-loop domain-containing transporter [Nitrospirota bacterium]
MRTWECFKNKSASGITPLFVGLWIIGKIFYVESGLMNFGWVGRIM